jgi:hypothetical protein
MKRACIALATLFVATTVAVAGTKSLNLSRSQFTARLNGQIEEEQSVLLPDGVFGRAVISFILPKDFLKNSSAKVILYFAADGGACNFDIETDFVYRSRLGVDEANSVIPAETGFSPVVAGPTPAPTAGVFRIFRKTFNLEKPSALPVSGQRAGDYVTVAIDRNGGSGEDSCATPLWLSGGKLVYKTL